MESCPSCECRLDALLSADATRADTPFDALTPNTDAPRSQLRAKLQETLPSDYEVESLIGSGGFADVYLVRDLTLKRRLAIKVLSPDLIPTTNALERFRREAETIAQLSHPNIVPIHFVGGKDDLFYLAMAFVDGESLADRIQREGPLPFDDVARILREMAAALDHAHRHDVIHRDIKPQNILIERESGRAFLTDFGIARTGGGSELTATGMIVGTPSYIAPEQVAGDIVDHRVDVYALGIVAYEMLTATVPFAGGPLTSVLTRRLSEQPEPINKLRPDTPVSLSALVERCLKVDPEDRVANGREIEIALASELPAPSSHSTTEMVRRVRNARNSTLLTVLAAVVLAAVGLLIWPIQVGRPSTRTTGTSDSSTPTSVLRSQATLQDSEPPQPSEPVAPRSTPIPGGMVRIPGGGYSIGSDDLHMYSRPAHEVRLVAFAMDRTEVRVADYAEFIAATGAAAPWTTQPVGTSPVTGVTWAEAAAHCAWRHGGGRLPTEQEWEAATRGSSGFRYPWGDVWEPGAANTLSIGMSSPATVGSYPDGANPLGIHDLIGNVWEWTSSRMLPYPNGTAPTEGERYYVIRGGAFNTPDSIADATRRGYLPPRTNSRGDFAQTGFRCVVELHQSP